RVFPRSFSKLLGMETSSSDAGDDMKLTASVFTLILILSAAPTCRSQAVPSAPQKQIFEAASLLKATYPELSGKNYCVSYEGGFHYDSDAKQLGTFEMSVGEGRRRAIPAYVGGYLGSMPPENYSSGPTTPKQYLLCHFTFTLTESVPVSPVFATLT